MIYEVWGDGLWMTFFWAFTMSWSRLLARVWSGHLRAALHYSGEVHPLVKNFSPSHGYLRRGMVCQRRWEDNKRFHSSWSSPQVKFLVWGFEVAQETWAPENSPPKKCRHVGNHVIFHPCTKFSTKKTLDCSVNHHHTRVSLSANQTFESP